MHESDFNIFLCFLLCCNKLHVFDPSNIMFFSDFLAEDCENSHFLTRGFMLINYFSHAICYDFMNQI